MKSVLITSLKNDFDKELACVFIREGFRVYAIGGEQVNKVTLLDTDLKKASSALQKDTGLIDIYIDTSDERSQLDSFDVRSGIDNDVMRMLFDANVTRPMALLDAFIPLLESGEGKRLCFITSAEASTNETHGACGYGYKMAKAAMHNFLQITNNALSPKGYTFRAFDPCQGELSVQMAAEAAYNYFTRRRGIERGDENRDDEKNIVFRDAYGRQHSW
ncbi:MAG: hypothetical protein FWD40_05700 [Treponema sp.]|nr:hypothetical protein [Treponema sp.]